VTAAVARYFHASLGLPVTLAACGALMLTLALVMARIRRSTQRRLAERASDGGRRLAEIRKELADQEPTGPEPAVGAGHPAHQPTVAAAHPAHQPTQHQPAAHQPAEHLAHQPAEHQPVEHLAHQPAEPRPAHEPIAELPRAS
jgi:hypothetical protein